MWTSKCSTSSSLTRSNRTRNAGKDQTLLPFVRVWWFFHPRCRGWPEVRLFQRNQVTPTRARC